MGFALARHERYPARCCCAAGRVSESIRLSLPKDPMKDDE